MTSSRREPAVILRPDGASAGEREVAIEAPVAVEVNGIGYAVMMMTPADLDAFAAGFLLSERLIDGIGDLIEVDPFEAETGWVLRVTIADRYAERLHERIRHRTSDASCGLCGIAGLEQLRRPVARTPSRPTVPANSLFAALASLRSHQPLNASTGAVHGAAACSSQGAILSLYEDVGRHNALDKLIGALARRDEAVDGFLLVTSRISFEMVDKALVARAPLLVGLSAPTTLAIEHAREHGLTLVALARGDAMLVLNDPWNLFTAGSGGGT